MPTHEVRGDVMWLLILLALTEETQHKWPNVVEEANRAEEEREQFRHYSEDCQSLDEHQDGNAYERLCTDPGHPYHGDPRPQCDRDLCPYLRPQGHPFRGCDACRASDLTKTF